VQARCRPNRTLRNAAKRFCAPSHLAGSMILVTGPIMAVINDGDDFHREYTYCVRFASGDQTTHNADDCDERCVRGSSLVSLTPACGKHGSAVPVGGHGSPCELPGPPDYGQSFRK
jgi:hypothetical protein